MIENHEKIQILSITHRNVTETLEEIDNIIDLPSNANIAECMLDDDGLLLDAYKALSTLEGTSNLVQDAMQSDHEEREEIQNLNEYFDKAWMYKYLDWIVMMVLSSEVGMSLYWSRG